MTMRLAFGLLLIAATALLWLPALDRALGRPEARRWLEWAFVASRLLGWLACYVAVPGLVRHSDLVMYYQPEASNVIVGLAPYRDFPTSYGPGFPYLTAAALGVWNQAASIALLMVAFEIAAVRLFVRLDRGDGRAMARTLFVYLLNPAALYWSGMLGYNSPVVLFFWVLAVAAVASGRPAASALAVAGSVIVGKFLGVLLAPVWLVFARRRLGLVAIVAGAGLAALLAARFAGLDLLLPLQREGHRSTSANLWFLATAIPGVVPGGVLWRVGPMVALAVSAGALMVALARRWANRPAPTLAQLSAAVAAVGWVFMLLSKKSFPHYTPMFVLFFCYAICASRPGERRWPLLLAVLGAIGILEPGLWNALRQPEAVPEACAVACQALVAADVALVGITIAMLAVALQSLEPAAAPPSDLAA
jgi:hypothetical protein